MPLGNQEVRVHEVQEGPFKGRVLAAIAIAAKPQDIWRVMTDCPNAPSYIPWVVHCELLESQNDGQQEIFFQQIKFAWYLPELRNTFQLNYYPYRQIDFHRLSGSPRRFTGSWWLEPYAGTVWVIYSVELETSFIVPRRLALLALRNQLPEGLRALRREVEGH